VEKEKYELFTEVLKRLEKAGVLNELMIAGSWNIFLYDSYFGKDAGKIPPIRTTDVDFLVPRPFKMTGKIDLPEILKDLGYIVQFKGSEGFIKLLHPDLLIEFIVPEKGRGVDNKPVPLPGMGVNASALRFMNILYENIMTITYEGVKVNIAHPAALAFHYLMIYPRRKNKEKAEKNFDHAIAILNLLIEKKKTKEMLDIFNKLHENWRKEIIELLEKTGQRELAVKLKIL
jgi:tetratricopeptide (TPR) repeat protein